MKQGYTHLLDTITYEKDGDAFLIGWGKYYGRMVEKGTVKMSARPHMIPLWEQNSDKYYKHMAEKFAG